MNPIEITNGQDYTRTLLGYFRARVTFTVISAKSRSMYADCLKSFTLTTRPA